ncbi:hypothetical protein [Enterobacter chuandaensis]|uniref:Uncharacterized protein n=1 Tax=Enterobacter chuandaensis TaxID=2497875 RepID=A0AA96RVU9_9ENTR|nr:hypothetical protein [Enterobacter chuandaensis]MCM7589109.1 hypothetical protein [Enterobacter chuandaensis]MCW4783393.1 hypothetical protein [Enterobacter chuandaensis]MDA4760691.1 hypothetical protein [Enterobacter chuandaensis]WNS40356.1 hypothetical protein RQP59_20995 [Enterobacter chuandaensis]
MLILAMISTTQENK